MAYGYAVRPLPRGWEVFRPDGDVTVPQLWASVGSLADAVTLRDMLNSVHPDAMVSAMHAGVSAKPEDFQ
jgi:hypothetical protein